MDYNTYPCQSDLSVFIKCFWTLRVPAEVSSGRQQVLPDGCMDLIFNLGDDVRRILSDDSFLTQPPAFVLGQSYSSIFDIQIEEMEIPGMSIALFPFEGQDTVGVIIAGEEYQPSAHGATIYFNAGDDLQIVLDRVEGSGGEILVPKTPYADESGFFALLKDTEGNRIGLHSNG